MEEKTIYGKRTRPRILLNALTYLTVVILDQLLFVPVELIPVGSPRCLTVLQLLSYSQSIVYQMQLGARELITKASFLPSHSRYMVLCT